MISEAFEFTVTGQTVNTYQPYASVYATTGADMNVHLYGLNLTDATKPPAPQQIGNLSLASTALICDYSSAETNLLAPTTLFIVLHLAGTNGTCGTTTATGDQWVLVNYTDSLSTAPTVLGITTTDFTALYAASGMMSGIVSLDPGSSTLYFYASQAFTSPRMLASGVTMIDRLDDIETLRARNQFTSSQLWLGVTTMTGESLYTITNTGTATVVYVAKGTLGSGANGGVDDSTNAYFTDTFTAMTGQQTSILAAPLGGGGAKILYTTAISAPQPNLVGSNDTVLVYYTNNFSPATGMFWTLPNNTAGSPQQIGTALTGAIEDARMYAPIGAGPSRDSLFVTVRDDTKAPIVSYSSEVLNPGNGGVLQALTAGSAFLDKATALSGTQFQVQGITDTGGGYGGATLYNVDIGTLAAHALTTTGGAAFKVPAGDLVSMFGESNTIGAGVFINLMAGGDTGVAFDLSQLLIVPVSVSNANVTPF
ncbi:MAG: hypothetical protein ACHQ0J_14350 [Candidatus Dormibacterales bacterium]